MMNNFARFEAFYKTASLWTGKLLGLQQFQLANFNFAHLLQQDTLTLPAIPQGTLLGKRAEYFFKFCVEQSSNYELLLSNVQIFNGKITLGELDYIAKETATGAILHIELVYKFYIYQPHVISNEKTPILQELHKYRGPNDRDHLVSKIQHLKNHQLPLLHASQTVKLLKSHDINAHLVKQQVCYLAHVFIPHLWWNHKFEYINKKSIAGYYYDILAFAKAETNNIYFLPEKYAWKMAPQQLPNSYTFQEIVKLTIESLNRGFAPLIWMQLEDKTFERFFVIK